jgi:transposase
MDVMVARCAGVDIGKDEVVACVRTPGEGGKGRRKETRTFSSFTSQLEVMADWFAAEGVTTVVMEATGSYWKSPWYVLEERGFDLKLVNARHVKIVPGRKTDVADAEWLAELLEHGLLRGSFVPPTAIRELRDLTRYRTLCRCRHSVRYAEDRIMPIFGRSSWWEPVIWARTSA